MTYWVLPENYEKGKKLCSNSSVSIWPFSRNTSAPIPFRTEKYGVAETPFLGMEHQTIIAYGANYSNEPHGYDISSITTNWVMNGGATWLPQWTGGIFGCMKGSVRIYASALHGTFTRQRGVL